jgi:Protein of unknown function (DUF3617)
MNMRKIALLLPLIMAGCGGPPRDAASEPAIALKGGVYSVTFEGSAFGVASPIPLGEQSTDRVCVRFNEGDGWIYKAVREKASKGPECRTEDSKRTGNALSARLVCQLRQGEGGGQLVMDYSGTVSEDAIDLTGKIKPPANLNAPGMSAEEQKQIEMMLKIVDVSIRIRREGDC